MNAGVYDEKATVKELSKLSSMKGRQWRMRSRKQQAARYPGGLASLLANARPIDAGSRRDLIHDALIRASAIVGCAKDISIVVHGHAAVRSRAVAAIGEVMKVGKCPTVLSRG